MGGGREYLDWPGTNSGIHSALSSSPRGGGCTDRQASIYQAEIHKHSIFKPSPI